MSKQDNKPNWQHIHTQVVKLVETGTGIKEAVKQLGYRTWEFYANITDQQKIELKQAKQLNAATGPNYLYRHRQLDTHFRHQNTDDFLEETDF